MVIPDTEQLVLGIEMPELAEMVHALNDPTTLTYRSMFGSVAIGWDATNDPSTYQVESPSMDGSPPPHRWHVTTPRCSAR